MKKDIEAKIKNLLSISDEFKESEIVYILIESYKLVEREYNTEFKEKFPYVVFFRNWVAHTELDRSPKKIKYSDLIVSNELNVGALISELEKIFKIKIESEKKFNENLFKVLENQPIFIERVIIIKDEAVEILK